MKKRPDAEKFLQKCKDCCIILGMIGLVLGVFISYSGEQVGGIILGGCVVFLLCAVLISICIRFHNVLLDIRDAEYETVRLLNSIQLQLSNNMTENTAINQDNEKPQSRGDSQS